MATNAMLRLLWKTHQTSPFEDVLIVFLHTNQLVIYDQIGDSEPLWWFFLSSKIDKACLKYFQCVFTEMIVTFCVAPSIKRSNAVPCVL